MQDALSDLGKAIKGFDKNRAVLTDQQPQVLPIVWSEPETSFYASRGEAQKTASAWDAAIADYTKVSVYACMQA